MIARRIKVYFDGGCRPNPGRMEAAVVARGVTHLIPDLGQGDNSDAEWLALIAALRVGRALEAPFLLLGDSALVVNQAIGAWPCRSARLEAHRAAFLALAEGRDIRVRRIPRAQNLAGIALDRQRSLHRAPFADRSP